jgi:hypothetical protein
VEGVHAICSTCLRVFPVERPGANGSAGSIEAESEMATEATDVETSVETYALSDPDEEPDGAAEGPVTGALSLGVSRFGARDPS